MKALKILIPIGIIIATYFLIDSGINEASEIICALVMVIAAWYLIKQGVEAYIKSRKK